MMSSKPLNQHAVIIFDGLCNLCHWLVIFVLRRDPAGYFRFVSLQSEQGEKICREFNLLRKSEHEDTGQENTGQEKNGVGERPPETVYLIEKGNSFSYSTAALRIFRHLKGLWKIFYIFILIPPLLRDPVYRWIARNRYRWFGKKDQCPVPLPGYRDRFLS